MTQKSKGKKTVFKEKTKSRLHTGGRAGGKGRGRERERKKGEQAHFTGYTYLVFISGCCSPFAIRL